MVPFVGILMFKITWFHHLLLFYQLSSSYNIAGFFRFGLGFTGNLTLVCSIIPFDTIGIRKVFTDVAFCPSSARNAMKMWVPFNSRLHPILTPSVWMYDGHSSTLEVRSMNMRSVTISCSVTNLKRQLEGHLHECISCTHNALHTVFLHLLLTLWLPQVVKPQNTDTPVAKETLAANSIFVTLPSSWKEQTSLLVSILSVPGPTF